MTPDEIIAVVTAFREGKQIEKCFATPPVHILNDWKPSGYPIWNFNLYNYRVKQEPPFIKGEPVMVRQHDNNKWCCRYFSHESNGIKWVYSNGATPWSNEEHNQATWQQIRRPTQEELKYD